MRSERKLVALSLIMALFVWIADSFIHSFYSQDATFWELLLFHVAATDIFLRLLVIGSVLLFGFVVLRIVRRFRKAEQARLRSEEQFRLVLKNSRDMLYKLDPKAGRFDYVSPSVVQLTGLEPEELAAGGFGEFTRGIHPEDQKRYLSHLDSVLQQTAEDGLPPTIEYRWKHKDGGYRWFSENRSVLRSELGRPGAIVGTIRDVTELKAVEREVSDSERRYRTLVETAQEGINFISPEEQILFTNRAFASILGYDPSELIGRNLREFVSEEQYRIFKAETVKRSKGVPSRYEIKMRRRDGSSRSLLLSASPLYDTEGNYQGSLGMVIDITERKQAEEQIKRQHDFLQSTIESLDHPFYVIDVKDYTIKMANSAAGFGDLSHKATCHALTHRRNRPCDGDEHPCPLKIVKETKKPATSEHLHYDQNGNPRVVEVHGYPIFDDQGNVSQVIQYTLDITERKKAEEALRESEKRYRTIFDNSPVALWEVDFSEVKAYIDSLQASGVRDFRQFFVKNPEAVRRCIAMIKVRDVNRASLELYHAEDTQELLHSLDKTFDQESYQVFREQLISVAEGKTEFQAETVTRKLTGESNDIIVRWTVVPGYEKTLSKVLVSITDITERKRAEEALRRSESKYQDLYNSAPAAYFSVGTDGLIRRVNRTAENFTGYTLEELRRMNVLDLYAEESAEKARKLFERFKRGIGWQNEEMVYLRKDGTKVSGLLSVSAVKDENGEVIESRSVVVDITERKRAEKALWESEQFGSDLLSNSPNPVLVINEDTSVRYVNPALEKLTGFSSADVVGTKVPYPWWTEETLQKTSEDLREAMREGARGLEELFQKKDGERFWVEITSVPVRGNGKFRYYLSNWVDITERKKAEEALRESEEKFRAVVENAPNLIVNADREGNILFVNRALSDTTLQEVVGTSVYDYILPEYHELVRATIREVFETGKPGRYEIRGQGVEGGTSWYETQVGAIRQDGKVVAVTLIITDTTGRKQAEQEVRKAKEFTDRLLAAMQDGLSVLDREGVHIAVNPAFCAMTGLSKEELIGVGPPHPYWAPEALKDIKKAFEKTLRGEFSNFELTFMRKSGERFPVIVSPSWIKDQDGGVVSYFATVKDITELKKAEEALREVSNKRGELEQIINRSPAVVFLWRRAEGWPVEFVSDNIGQFCYNPQDFRAGRIRYADLVHPDDLQRVAEEVERYSGEGRREFVQEYRIITGTGEVRWVDDRTWVRRNSKGIITHYQGIVVDITERKRAEEAIQQSEEKLDAMLRSIGDHVSMIDKDLNIIWANETAKRLFGEDIVGKKCYEAYHRRSKPCEPYPCLTLRAFQDGKTHEHDTQVIDKEGRILYFHCTANVALRDNNGEPTAVIEISTDITERKKAEEAVKSEKNKLEALMDGLNRIGIGIDIVTTDFRILAQNQTLRERFGDLTGKVCFQEYVGLKQPCDSCPMLRCTRSGKVESLEVTGTDGSIYEISSAPLLGPEGTIDRAIEVVQDITQRKRAEEEILRQSKIVQGVNKVLLETLTCESDLEVARKCLAVAEGLTQSKFGFLGEVNPEGGFDAIAMSDPGWEACRVPKTRAVRMIKDMEIRGIWGGVLKEGKSLLVNDPGSHPDRVGTPEGHPPLTCFLGVPLKHMGRTIGMIGLANKESGYQLDDQQAIEALSVTFVEALMRKRAEAALRESEEKARAILNAITEIAVLIDTTGTVLASNEITPKKLGKTLGEIAGKCIFDFFPPELAKPRKAAVNEVIRTGKPVQIEIQHESRFYDSRIYPIFNAQGVVAQLGIISTDITERKKAEEALRESEEKFRLLSEQSLLGILIAQHDSIVYANQAVAEVFELPMEEVINRKISQAADIIHPADRQFVMEQFRKKLAGEREVVTHYPFRLTTKTGRIKWIDLYSKTILYGGKNADLITVIDITDRKKAEEALRKSEEKYRLLVENQSDLVVKVDTEGNFLFVSPSYCETFGKTEEELLGQKFMPLVHEDDRELTAKAMENLYKPPYTCYVEQRAMTKKGWRWLAWADMAVLDEQGNVTAVVGVGRDITEQKEAQDAVRRSKAELQAILRSADDIIFTKDQKGRYTRVNSACARLFRLPEEEIVRKTDFDLFPEDYARREVEIDRQVLEQGKSFTGEQTKPIAGKMHTFHVVKTPLHGPDGSVIGLCGIARDMTEQRSLEEQLRQAQKMESLGTLAGGVAHDFNNLLGGILGYVGLMKRDYSPGEPQYAYLDLIEKAGQRAAELTSQLLAFSRKGKYQIRPLDLNTCVENVLKLIARTLDKSIEIVTRLEEKLPAVQGDSAQVEQAILNLCVNAAEAMPNGGTLTLQTRAVELEEQFTRKYLNSDAGECLLLSVSDTGVGMDAQTLSRIFEPFFTTKETGKGTGLGLSTVYGIITNHGGYIDVRSQPNEGTTFDIYLPASKGKFTPAPEKRGELETGHETILAVDDEEIIRSLLEETLKKLGYRVMLARDGKEAVEIFDSHKEEIDAVIIDMVMPQMGGRDTFREIKKRNPEVKVLLATGYSQDRAAQQILDEGVRGFIQKPFDLRDLSQKLREVLD